jgi:hypothetical protein
LKISESEYRGEQAAKRGKGTGSRSKPKRGPSAKQAAAIGRLGGKKKGQISKGSTEAKQSKGTKKKTTNKSGMTDRQKTSYDRLRKIGWNHSRALNKAAGKKKKASMSGIKSVSDTRKSLSGKRAPEKTWEDRFKSATSGKKKAVKPTKPTKPSRGDRLRKYLGFGGAKPKRRQWSRGKS